MSDGNKNLCGICKKVIENGDKVEFCPDCGQIVHTDCLQNTGCNCDKKTNSDGENKMSVKKSTVAKIIIAVVCIATAVVGIMAAQSVNTVDDFCDRGDYEAAYGIADDGEKKAIKGEEFALPKCANIPYILREINQSEFKNLEFKEIYYLSNDDFTVTATVIVTEYENSEEKTEKKYWLYALDGEGKECSEEISDIEEEKIYLTDSEEQIEEKNRRNYARNLIKKVMSSEGDKVKVSGIRRINKWYKSGELDRHRTIVT